MPIFSRFLEHVRVIRIQELEPRSGSQAGDCWPCGVYGFLFSFENLWDENIIFFIIHWLASVCARDGMQKWKNLVPGL